MAPEQCLLCWSWSRGDIKSANCRSRIATAASITNVVFRTISLDSRVIGRPSQEMGYVAAPIVTAVAPDQMVLTYSYKGKPTKSWIFPDGGKPDLCKNRMAR